MTPSRWQEIERVYQAALERVAGERAAFLTEACRGDAELRREVESLLASGSAKPGAPEGAARVGVTGLTVADPTVTALTPGTQLGPYQIEGTLGKGGMGEVFRGVDTRLGRAVAIKTSQEQFSERFSREARVIASLNHPNICTLYDVGPNYLVMELCEGETLAARLKRGKLSIQETLRYGTQIADALSAAHAKEIVHRDLKPHNVMVGKSSIKVLDFGLAKSQHDKTLTALPAVMGTPAYMAPEQREGQECDARTDIYSLGLVLYEMATGKRADQQQMPPLDQLPEKLAHAIERCLAPDPDGRWQSAADLRAELEWVGKSPLQAPAPQSALHPSPKRGIGWLWPAVSAVSLGAAVTLAVVHFRETAPPAQNLRYTITVPEGGTVQNFAISPDGRSLAMAAAAGGKRQLWLRAMDALQAQPMPFTEDATDPFWSPDSRNIGFFAQGKLKIVAASGGPAQSLCDAPLGFGGSWSRDGVIVFSPNNAGISIQRVAAAGGACVDATRTKGALWWPAFLPDGRHFLYTMTGASIEKEGIYLSSPDGSENRRVLADVSGAVYAPPARGERAGHILFVRANTLMAQPFDATGAQVLGDAFPVVEDVANRTATVSENGVLVYRAAGAGGNQIGWYDRTGKPIGLVSRPGGVTEPALSPDEKLVVFSRATPSGFDLWVWDQTRRTESRFTSDPSNNGGAFYSPDGDRIVFVSNRGGHPYNLYEKAAHGTVQEQALLPTGLIDIPSQWSRAGIVYSESDPKTNRDLWILPMGSDGSVGKPTLFLRSEFNELYGQISQDGHWMAFTSDRSGRREVYVRPFPPGEGEWPVSTAGGQGPRWRGDGKELFYEAENGKMMAVPVNKAIPGAKPIFEPGIPAALFDAHMSHNVTDFDFEYDVTKDGQRFLINTTADSGESGAPLTVVTNWLAGVKK